MAVKVPAFGSNILADILDWSDKLPGWQKDALRRIVEDNAIPDRGIAELTVLCKRECGLEVNGPELTVKPLLAAHVPKGEPSHRSVTLRSVSRVENVNVLDSKQHLEFANSGLTVIFGYNASGKSGYGRILRRACRARNKGSAIVPNVMETNARGPACAEITYALVGDEQPPEQWIDEQRSIDALGAVSFFDSQCALTHARERIDIAFTPFGLDVLPKLGAACREVQGRLDSERKQLESMRPQFLQSPIANGSTTVGRLLSSLRANTDTERIDRLASLSDEEKDRLKSLPVQLANDPRKQSQLLRNQARQIAALRETLETSHSTLSDHGIDRVKALAADYQLKAKAADAAAKVSFSDDPLPEIGEDAWRRLWEAARQYSTVAYPGRDFPVITGGDARCVLCQQTLDDEAKNRLQRFEQFVTDNTARDAASAKQVLDMAIRDLDALGLREQTLHDQLAVLKLVNQAVWKSTRQVIATLLRRARAVKAGYDSSDWGSLKLPVLSSRSELTSVVEELINRATELEQTADPEGRGRLQAELDELKAREWLATVLGDVKEHVNRLVEIDKLNECVETTRTNGITAKSKSLAKMHVTDRLRDAFASEIRQMSKGVRRLNVELAATAGEYGSSYYRIQIVGASKAAIETVVSEGEHQCIALAGFLSELAMEQSQSAIVFDDPVCSLDYLWAERFARRVVDEAAKRQVIVFTHDVLFLHDLSSFAEDRGVPIDLKQLLAIGDTCGHVGTQLPNDLQGLKARINSLEQEHSAISRLHAGNVDGYDMRVKSFYDQLRAAVERAVEERVFNGVILRFRNEVKVGLLPKVAVLTRQNAEDLHNLHIQCSENITGHDRAALRGGTRLTPDDLKADLDQLKRVASEINARQNAIK